MKKILVVALALVLCFALCSVASVKTYELKIIIPQTDSSMIYAGMQTAANEIMAKTGGEVKVTIYPPFQLGGEEDMIDQAIAGIFNMVDFVDSCEVDLRFTTPSRPR